MINKVDSIWLIKECVMTECLGRLTLRLYGRPLAAFMSNQSGCWACNGRCLWLEFIINCGDRASLNCQRRLRPPRTALCWDTGVPTTVRCVRATAVAARNGRGVVCCTCPSTRVYSQVCTGVYSQVGTGVYKGVQVCTGVYSRMCYITGIQKRCKGCHPCGLP